MNVEEYDENKTYGNILSKIKKSSGSMPNNENPRRNSTPSRRQLNETFNGAKMISPPSLLDPEIKVVAQQVLENELNEKILNYSYREEAKHVNTQIVKNQGFGYLSKVVQLQGSKQNIIPEPIIQKTPTSKILQSEAVLLNFEDFNEIHFSSDHLASLSASSVSPIVLRSNYSIFQ